MPPSTHAIDANDHLSMNIFKKISRIFGGEKHPDIRERLVPSLSSHLVCCGIGSAIRQSRPFLVSRLGWFETYSIGYWESKGTLNDSLRERMWNNPGIFPATDQGFQTFHMTYTEAMKDVDILGLMKCPYEKVVVTSHAPQASLCELGDLEPYYHPVPWSKYLTGLRVLVVHPFARSIEFQYRNERKRLFLDPDVLPEFELLTIVPPQTLSGNTDGYSSWSDALAALLDKISAQKFDIAIIGCGAYGLPAGAFVKKLGKVAIHLGGATQMLFGVFGSRWEAMPFSSIFINSNWKRPEESERPSNWENVESGCYW